MGYTYYSKSGSDAHVIQDPRGRDLATVESVTEAWDLLDHLNRDSNGGYRRHAAAVRCLL
jgi:hypothetical protein